MREPNPKHDALPLGEALRAANKRRKPGPIGQESLIYYSVWIRVGDIADPFPLLLTPSEFARARKRAMDHPEDIPPLKPWWKFW